MLASILIAMAISLLFGYNPNQFVITGNFSFTSGVLPVWFLFILAPIFEELAWQTTDTDNLTEVEVRELFNFIQRESGNVEIVFEITVFLWNSFRSSEKNNTIHEKLSEM